jgi:excisionase family DNA binding protein
MCGCPAKFLHGSTAGTHKHGTRSLSIADTVSTLGIGRSKIYELIKAGQLETIKIGRRTLVRVTSIHNLVARAPV